MIKKGTIVKGTRQASRSRSPSPDRQGEIDITCTILKKYTLLTAERFHELHPNPCYKLLTENMIMNKKYQWIIGKNALTDAEKAEFKAQGTCNGVGLYFTDKDHLADWCSSGYTKIGIVTIVPGTLVWTEDLSKFKAQEMILSNVVSIVEFALQNPDSKLMNKLLNDSSVCKYNHELLALVIDKIKTTINDLTTDAAKVDAKFLFLAQNMFMGHEFNYDRLVKTVFGKLVKIISKCQFPITYLANTDTQMLVDEYKGGKLTAAHLVDLGFHRARVLELLIRRILSRNDHTFNDTDCLIDDNLETNVLAILGKQFLTNLKKISNRCPQPSKLGTILATICNAEIQRRFGSILSANVTYPAIFAHPTGTDLKIGNKKCDQLRNKILTAMNNEDDLGTVIIELMKQFRTGEIARILEFLQLTDQIESIADTLSQLDEPSRRTREFVKQYSSKSSVSTTHQYKSK